MENYNFWQDFFATYRSSPDAIKALWIIAPLAFVIALAWIALRSAACKRGQQSRFSSAFENRPFENPAGRGSAGQVLILGRGRLLDRFEIPDRTDARRADAER